VEAGATGAARRAAAAASSLARSSLSPSPSSGVALLEGGGSSAAEAAGESLSVRGSLGIRASTGTSTGSSVSGGSGRDLESIPGILQRRGRQANATPHKFRAAAPRNVTRIALRRRHIEMCYRYCVTLGASGVRYIAPAMHLTRLLEHESPPESAYARELRGGFHDLRFAPDLERVFQAFHLKRARARVRFFQLALGLLAIAAAVDLTVLDAVPLRQVVLGWVGVVMPACLALALTSWSRLYERLYLPAARVLLPVIAAVSAVGVADRRVAGHADLFYFLTSFSIAIFFLGGQLFREALLVNTFMTVAFGLALAHAGWGAPEILYYLTVLVITSAVGAFVYQGVERQLRCSFLERGLLSEMVARDGLTGLKNRGAFEEDYARLWQHAARDRCSLAVLLIDVDHFKAYNDRYGHQAGDRALRRVAQVVHRFARRPLDIAARYGGEEFLVALHELGADPVRAIAEELREGIQALGIEHDESPAGVVTVSIGVAIVSPRPGRTPEDAVQLADEALYSAKRAGRNVIHLVDCCEGNYSTDAFRRSA
jgi:diguanylate cyclase (GGDEF)-like protein